MRLKAADDEHLVKCFWDHEKYLESYSSQRRVNKRNWREFLDYPGQLSIIGSKFYGDYWSSLTLK